MPLKLDDFDYCLPQELIAQKPADRREDARLMVLDRAARAIEHSRFSEIGRWLPQPGLLVLNDAKVMPVRLDGRKNTGGRLEVTLLEPPLPEAGPGDYEIACLVRPAKRLRPGQAIYFNKDLTAEVREVTETGRTSMKFRFAKPPLVLLEESGRMPLPPYIKRTSDPRNENGYRKLDLERYQTVYARSPGAVAAPTAGLHFNETVLNDIKRRGFEISSLTLLVGHGTFAPVKVDDITRHRMHSEQVIIPDGCVQAVNRAKTEGRAVTAVGTTSVRALEYAAQRDGLLKPYAGPCDLFIYPGREFRLVDHLITNFHLPRSTLLMLAAAFAGLDTILEAYRVAVAERYRFFSYGDSMLII